MAEKNIQVTVSGSAVSVDQPSVELQKNVDQARWSVTVDGLDKLTLTRKDNGEVLASCEPGNGSNSCFAKSKTFSTDGKIEYMVTVRVNGTDRELDPDLIIKP